MANGIDALENLSNENSQKGGEMDNPWHPVNPIRYRKIISAYLSLSEQGKHPVKVDDLLDLVIQEFRSTIKSRVTGIVDPRTVKVETQEITDDLRTLLAFNRVIEQDEEIAGVVIISRDQLDQIPTPKRRTDPHATTGSKEIRGPFTSAGAIQDWMDKNDK